MQNVFLIHIFNIFSPQKCRFLAKMITFQFFQEFCYKQKKEKKKSVKISGSRFIELLKFNIRNNFSSSSMHVPLSLALFLSCLLFLFSIKSNSVVRFVQFNIQKNLFFRVSVCVKFFLKQENLFLFLICRTIIIINLFDILLLYNME